MFCLSLQSADWPFFNFPQLNVCLSEEKTLSAVLVVFPGWPNVEFGGSAVLDGATVESHACLVSEMSIIHHATGTDSKSAWLQFSHLLFGCSQSAALFSWLPSPASVSLCFSSSVPCAICVWPLLRHWHSFVCGLSALPWDEEVILCCHHFLHQAK